MDSEAIWSLIGKAVAALGGLTVILLGLYRWLGGRLADRLYLRWKHDYDKELENLRSQLSITQGLLNAALGSASQAYMASQERIVKAVETAWSSIVGIHNYCQPFLFIYELLLQKEYSKVFSDPNLKSFLPKGSLAEQTKKLSENSELREENRPFLGERLWALLWTYRAVVGRLCLKLVQERDKGKIYAWYMDTDGTEDTFLLELLRNALNEDEIRLSKEREVGGHSLLMSLLEQKILAEADRRVSGRHISEVTVEEGIRLAKLMSQGHQNTWNVSIHPNDK